MLCDDRAIDLRPKTWAVLLHLVGRRGFLVTRSELLDSVWEGTAVSDDNLTQSITEIRHALGDSARSPRFVETVHKRGFRFIAEVRDRRRNGREPLTATFVGREAELARLQELFGASASSERRVVFVTGEAGIGKTSLVECFVRSLRGTSNEGLRVARGQAIEQFGSREPYLPVLEALDRLARGSDGERVLSVLADLAPSWRRQLAPFPASKAANPVAVTPERMLREIAGALEKIAAEKPLVMVLEDLHWSDPSTIDFVSRIAERSEAARLLLLVTYRPAEASVLEHPVATAKIRLEARDRAVEIALEELGPDAVKEYLAARFPSARQLDDLAAWIRDRSEGSPLFMVALADQLTSDREPTVPTAGRQLEIPRNLRGALESSIAKADGDARRVLDAASGVGPSFDACAVAAAIDSTVADVETTCEDLVRKHGLLQRREARDWPDGSIGGRYAFRHSLYREVLYERLSPAMRRELHRRIAERLEIAWDGRTAEIATDLALHFERAGDRMRAVAYLGEAGRRALGGAAFREARECFEAALDQLRQTPESEERDRLEVGFLQALSVILAGAGFYSAAELGATLERTMHICERIQDRSGLFDAHYARWFLFATNGNRGGAYAETEALDRLGEELRGVRRVFADNAMCERMVWGGEDLEIAKAVAERGFSADEAAVDAELEGKPHFGIDPIVGAGVHLGYALWLLGFPDRAFEVERRALVRAERLSGPFTLTQALGQQSVPCIGCGRFDAALEVTKRAREIAVEYGLTGWALGMELDHRSASVLASRDAGELPLLRKALDDWLATGSLICSPFYARYAEACLTLGEFATGLAVARECLAKIEYALDQLFVADLHRLEGELVLAAAAKSRKSREGSAAVDEAARCFEVAIARARSQKARIFELRALTSLARVRDAARPELEKLLLTLSEASALPDFVAATRALDRR